MEIKVLEHKKSKLRIEVKGEDHTFLNILKKELYNDSSLKYAGYKIEHAHVGIPELIIETENKDAKKVLLNAVSRVKKLDKEILSKFKKL